MAHLASTRSNNPLDPFINENLRNIHVSRFIIHAPKIKMPKNGKKLVLGIEGSANKIGVGIVNEDGDILSNPRHT